ncbi:hypothetical protein Pla175_05050 [Pirellulimonas nuda]|uniref:Uncharacterized protein n=1 Tax=Pirellulimonas nuda TaxID=2528009 RepID=A0A518D6S9_9BACT|nr:hypothetical protein [Pirellulimonas nuda]QDU87149.1 hypothetical protein Pla175_05050 [Pirellulimonas nuda]
MPDKFDPYREALVMETLTQWPADLAHVPQADRARIAAALHADARGVERLSYVRTHTGFQRRIEVSVRDLERMP